MGNWILDAKKIVMCLTIWAPFSLAQTPAEKTSTFLSFEKNQMPANAVNITPKFYLKKDLKDFFPSERTLILDMEHLNNLQRELPEGPRTGGGGNSCALSIAQTISVIKNQLKDTKSVGAGDKSFLSLDQINTVINIIDKTKIYLSSSLVLDGEEKDAINFPYEQEIIISRQACDNVFSYISGAGLSLLFHEFLGLAKIDDRQYQVSGPWLKAYNATSDQSFQMQLYVDSEAHKDLAGKESCFKGRLKDFYRKNIVKPRTRPEYRISLQGLGSEQSVLHESIGGKNKWRKLFNFQKRMYLTSFRFYEVISHKIEDGGFTTQRDKVALFKVSINYHGGTLLNEAGGKNRHYGNATTYTCESLDFGDNSPIAVEKIKDTRDLQCPEACEVD